MSKEKASRLITITLLALLAALFALWALKARRSVYELSAAVLCCGLFGYIVSRFVPSLLCAFGAPASLSPCSLCGPRTLRNVHRRMWVRIAIAIALSRIALAVVAYIAYTLVNGYQGGIIDTLREIWLRTDSPSYLGIAENWYVTTGDPRFHIVFFPMYPLLIKAVWFIVGDYFAAAMIVSNACAIGAGVMFYELMLLDVERDDALRALKYIVIVPGAFFLSAPMTESLFLLLCVSSMFFARKRSFVPASALAAFAGFTRAPGVLLTVPIAIEMALELYDLRNDRKFAKTLVTRALTLLIAPLGLAGYVFINYTVTGDPFKFMEYQREHWNQGMSLFFGSPAYQLSYALRANDRELWGLFIPNLICGFGALAIFAASLKRPKASTSTKGGTENTASESTLMRPSYTAYLLAYFVITTGVSWLLSAPRYLAVCFPIAMALALLTRDRRSDIVASAACIAGLVAYTCLYVLGYPVY